MKKSMVVASIGLILVVTFVVYFLWEGYFKRDFFIGSEKDFYPCEVCLISLMLGAFFSDEFKEVISWVISMLKGETIGNRFTLFKPKELVILIFLCGLSYVLYYGLMIIKYFAEVTKR